MDKQTIQALKGHLLAAKALKDSMEKSLASTSKDNIWKYASFKAYMSTYLNIVSQVSSLINITAPIGICKEWGHIKNGVKRMGSSLWLTHVVN